MEPTIRTNVCKGTDGKWTGIYRFDWNGKKYGLMKDNRKEEITNEDMRRIALEEFEQIKNL